MFKERLSSNASYDIALAQDLFNEITIKPAKQKQDLSTKQDIFSEHESGQLVMAENVLNELLSDKSLSAKKFALRRLKMLFHRCSKDIRQRRISLESVNRLAAFCLEIIPLIEGAGIVMPTAVEFSALIDWYLDKQTQPRQTPAIVLTTVCPDYPYNWLGDKAMYENGLLGDNIGLIGESIMKTGPHLLNIMAKTLQIPFAWVVGYAGFEAKASNLENMKISAQEFRGRLEKSALKLQQKINIPVVMLPEAVGVSIKQFDEIKESFSLNDFIVQRKGMDALASAVDARDWASVFFIANKLNAIIVDGASVYMGRKAYRKARQILKPANHTPSFFCVTPYLGFSG